MGRYMGLYLGLPGGYLEKLPLTGQGGLGLTQSDLYLTYRV